MNTKLEALKTGLAILIAISLMVPAANVLAQGQAGTTLSATVTAYAIYETRYTWTIGKTAYPTEVRLYPDGRATVTYTVSVTKRATYSYYIEGQVCVTNGGGVATEGLNIRLDVYVGSGWKTQIIDDYPVDVSSKPVLGPGESYCYPYRIDIPEEHWGYSSFKVFARVKITNHGGHLNEPWGPEPANTTGKEDVTVGHDCINVMDTNGYTWSTCTSETWTYTKTFAYDPDKGDYYEHVNTATIVQTGQSASWTVKVYQEIVVTNYATISGTVFWDNNYNRVYDEGDKAISGAAVHLYKYDEETGEWDYVDTAISDEYGYYYFEVEPGFTYRVEVVKPVCGSCDMIVNTTPTYYVIENVEEGRIYVGNDFGFVCLRMLTGAYSKGYWSWSQYNKRTGQWQTRVTSDDVYYINTELGTSFRSPKELADYLTAPVYGDMPTILTQQLIATLLNLKYGYISGDTVVYYGGRYMTINEIVENAKEALASGTRCEQEHWKDLLDAINNKRVYYVYVIN